MKGLEAKTKAELENTIRGIKRVVQSIARQIIGEEEAQLEFQELR